MLTILSAHPLLILSEAVNRSFPAVHFVQHREQLVLALRRHFGLIAEAHDRVGAFVLRPFGETAAVGVSVHAEIAPIAEHLRAQLTVSAVIQLRVVWDIAVAVDLLAAVPVAEPAVLFGEIIFINGNAVVRRETVQAVVRIIKEHRAVHLRPVFVRLVVGLGGVEGEDFVGVLLEIIPDFGFIVAHIRAVEHDERRAFLAVVAVEDRLLVMNALAVGFIRRFRQRVAVDRDVVVLLGV